MSSILENGLSGKWQEFHEEIIGRGSDFLDKKFKAGKSVHENVKKPNEQMDN